MRMSGAAIRRVLAVVLALPIASLSSPAPARAATVGPLGPQPLIASSPVTVTGEGGYNAFPDGFQLPNGTIRVTYTNSTYHGGPGTSYIKSSTDGGKTWSTRSVAGTLRSPVQLQSGKIVAASMSPMGSLRGAASMYSTDGGVVWHNNGLAANGAGFTAESYPYGLVRMKDGSLLMVVAGRDTSGTEWYVRYLRSTNEGVSWAITATVKDTGRSYQEPSLAAAPDGTLVSAMRVDNQNGSDGNIYFTQSVDAGRTWTTRTPALTHASGHPRLAFLPDGSLVVMYRSTWTDFFPFRYARSLDKGKTWTYGMDFTGDWQQRMVYGAWLLGPDPTSVGVVYALEKDWYNATVYYRKLTLPKTGIEVRGMTRTFIHNGQGSFVHVTGREVFVGSDGSEKPQTNRKLSFTLRSFAPKTGQVVVDRALDAATNSLGTFDVMVPLRRHGELVLWADGVPGSSPYAIGTYRSTPGVANCPTSQTAVKGAYYYLWCQGGQVPSGKGAEFQKWDGTKWVHQKSAWTDSTGVFKTPINISAATKYRLVIWVEVWTDSITSPTITVNVK